MYRTAPLAVAAAVLLGACSDLLTEPAPIQVPPSGVQRFDCIAYVTRLAVYRVAP